MDANQEKVIIQSLKKDNPDIPFLKLKKSFHKFGKPSDEKTLKYVIDDAKASGDFGLLVKKTLS